MCSWSTAKLSSVHVHADDLLAIFAALQLFEISWMRRSTLREHGPFLYILYQIKVTVIMRHYPRKSVSWVHQSSWWRSRLNRRIVTDHSFSLLCFLYTHTHLDLPKKESFTYCVFSVIGLYVSTYRRRAEYPSKPTVFRLDFRDRLFTRPHKTFFIPRLTKKTRHATGIKVAALYVFLSLVKKNNNNKHKKVLALEYVYCFFESESRR